MTYLTRNTSQTSDTGRRDDFSRLVSDYQMIAPISYEAQQHAALQKSRGSFNRSFLYQFSHRPTFSRLPLWQGVVHTDELPFVFGLPGGKFISRFLWFWPLARIISSDRIWGI